MTHEDDAEDDVDEVVLVEVVVVDVLVVDVFEEVLLVVEV